VPVFDYDLITLLRFAMDSKADGNLDTGWLSPVISLEIDDCSSGCFYGLRKQKEGLERIDQFIG